MEQNRRLIPVDQLTTMDTGLCDADGNMYGYAKIVPWDEIASLPTVDAVEVVRCKDCKHSELWGTEKRIGCEATYSRVCLNAGRTRCVKDDDYCSYGERKDND